VRRAFVSGATGGIGAAAIAEFAPSHEVVAQDLRAPQGRAEGAHEWVVGDLLDPDVRAQIESRVTDRLDALVVAHGLGGFTPLDQVLPEGIKRIMRVNYAAVVALVRSALPGLRAAKGAITVLASQAGLVGEPNNSVYSASKFAVVGWARSIAPHLATQGVRLRVLCPGCTDTELLRNAFETFAREQGQDVEVVREGRIEQIPVRRLASPREIGQAAKYLTELETPNLVVLNQSGGETFVS
jgi:NAD(P)-dependent dehydrogenase (short-subunit alcohol dehydrogenase family)